MIRAVLDADVLYPALLRDVLLSAAAEGCFQPAWSGKILSEAFGNLVEDGKMTPAQAAKTQGDMVTHFDEAMTQTNDTVVATMKNHPKDRHVAACAVAAEAGVIVTNNLKDFKALPDDIVAMNADGFLLKLLAKEPVRLRRSLETMSARMIKRPLSADEIVALLAGVAPKFVVAWTKAAA